MTEQIEQLKDMIFGARRAVFFGGAGVSTESGIPDFRSVDGIYHQKWAYPPETILSHSFFLKHTEEFFRFYREKMLFPDAKPGHAHRVLARLEQAGHISHIITQNIDGLHQAAGSKNVIELHGSVHRNHCMKCGKSYPGIEKILSSRPVPRCDCGGIIKPDVVLYEEALDEGNIYDALDAVGQADLLIIGGTSLTVYPAASFVQNYSGGKLIVMNKTPTPMDRYADLVITQPMGEALKQII